MLFMHITIMGDEFVPFKERMSHFKDSCSITKHNGTFICSNALHLIVCETRNLTPAKKLNVNSEMMMSIKYLEDISEVLVSEILVSTGQMIRIHKTE